MNEDRETGEFDGRQKGGNDDENGKDEKNRENEDHPANHILSLMASPSYSSFRSRDASRRQEETTGNTDTHRETFPE